MATDQLLTEVRDHVLYLTMNRPERLNAMAPDMMAALVENLEAAQHSRDVGCVVLTGAGRGFCAGGDVKAMNEANSGGGQPQILEDRVANLRRSEEASRLLHEMPKVTIAAVNGPAAGAGLSLAMAADLRIAAKSATFTTAFARVGFSGDFGGTWTLTQLVGTAKAREMYFMPEVIGADDALKLGLVNRVVETEALREQVHAVAKRIANGPTLAYRYIKSNLNAAITHDFRDLLDRESYGQSLTGRTEDHREAVKAFLEKREANFKGR
ncbi:MAG TPA: enoyl-CoA hydratase [Candidatus Binataceae bacterium]|nr:enoyl-CoA hydratase [Candidatus Binataceae bacterium]